jgi:hypothetical protein
MWSPFYAQMSSCLALGVNVWHIIKPIFPTFFITFPNFSTMFQMRFGLSHPLIASPPWCVSTHPIDFMGIHLLHCANGNKNMCSLQHFYCHCLRCWLSCRMRTITCISFNHVQLLWFINPHYVHQRWNSYFN